MSEEKICHCGHGFLDHGYEKNENPPPHIKRPCKKCECTNFQRPGAKRGAEDRARKTAEEEARKTAEEEARKTAEEEARKQVARKKEEKRLMLERIEQERLIRIKQAEEQLEKEQKFKKEHEIQSLFHICHIDNLLSIIDKGLFSRLGARFADCKFVDIADQGISGRRDDYNERLGLRLTTFASTYFEPINGMYWRVIPKEMDELGNVVKSYPKKIVVVEFKLDLSKEGIVITDGNAAEGEAVKTSYDDHLFVKIMSEIQEETINVKYRGEGKWSSVSEWGEHKRRKAAECLVPEKISRDCITSIHVYNDPETISTVQHLIDNSGDNSGLRINLKTIDRFQTSIKRG